MKCFVTKVNLSNAQWVALTKAYYNKMTEINGSNFEIQSLSLVFDTDGDLDDFKFHLKIRKDARKSLDGDSQG